MKPESDGPKNYSIEIPVSSIYSWWKKKREKEAIENIKRYEEVRKANAGIIYDPEGDERNT